MCTLSQQQNCNCTANYTLRSQLSYTEISGLLTSVPPIANLHYYGCSLTYTGNLKQASTTDLTHQTLHTSQSQPGLQKCASPASFVLWKRALNCVNHGNLPLLTLLLPMPQRSPPQRLLFHLAVSGKKLDGEASPDIYPLLCLVRMQHHFITISLLSALQSMSLLKVLWDMINPQISATLSLFMVVFDSAWALPEGIRPPMV